MIRSRTFPLGKSIMRISSSCFSCKALLSLGHANCGWSSQANVLGRNSWSSFAIGMFNSCAKPASKGWLPMSCREFLMTSGACTSASLPIPLIQSELMLGNPLLLPLFVNGVNMPEHLNFILKFAPTFGDAFFATVTWHPPIDVTAMRLLNAVAD